MHHLSSIIVTDDHTSEYILSMCSTFTLQNRVTQAQKDSFNGLYLDLIQLCGMALRDLHPKSLSHGCEASRGQQGAGLQLSSRPGCHTFRSSFSPSASPSIFLFPSLPTHAPSLDGFFFFFNLFPLQPSLPSPFSPHTTPTFIRTRQKPHVRAGKAVEGKGENPQSTKQVYRALSPYLSYLFWVGFFSFPHITLFYLFHQWSYLILSNFLCFFIVVKYIYHEMYHFNPFEVYSSVAF